jgi:hypothetical protein
MAILEIDPIQIWCEQELVVLRRQMELLRGGKVGTYERDEDGSQIDTSDRTVKQLELKITALQSLLTGRKMSACDTMPSFPLRCGY